VTPFWTDDHLTLYGGDCRAVLAEMPAESVHCVVTSPPYWGLRDYGTAAWDGGDEACDHAVGGQVAQTKHPAEGHATGQRPGVDASLCRKCGAVRIDSQLGLEPTPEAYVENMVAVFREVRRVLRADGTLWLNLGDSYASDMKGSGGLAPSPTLGIGAGGESRLSEENRLRSNRRAAYEPRKVQHGLKPKDLVGIPWRVAFALQADGWYLRSDIIWSKPNPMPESVTDRPTKAHEYLFLLTKSPRYYFDADAVREPSISPEQEAHNQRYAKVYDAHTDRVAVRGEGIQPGNVNNVGIHARPGQGGRNLRSVWTIATEPYPGAHFATFPRKLVEPCVKAGSPADGTVLDPFAGSGTTLLVAQALGRRGIGIDLNPDYLKQALVRNAQTPLGLVG
jgi:DNA modification methylase